MRVNRSGMTSRGGHGNEAVPTGLQGTGTAPAQRDAHAGAGRGPGRGGAHAGSQPADDLKLGQKLAEDPQAWRRKPLGPPWWFECRAEEAGGQIVAGGRGGQRLSDRTVDTGRVAKLIERQFGVAYQHGQRLRILRELGFSSQRPAGRAIQRDEAAIKQWRTKRWPAPKKKSRREGRTIVFIDESGLSERPTAGQDLGAQRPDAGPAIQLQLEATVGHRGISFWTFYFRLHAGAIRGPQFVEFLQALTKQIRGKLLVIWDGLPAHRSRVVKDYVEALDGHLVLERLPAYAPELNPVEYIWGYMKQRELANLCLHTIGEVGRFARNRSSPCNADRVSSPRSGSRQNCPFNVMYLRKSSVVEGDLGQFLASGRPFPMRDSPQRKWRSIAYFSSLIGAATSMNGECNCGDSFAKAQQRARTRIRVGGVRGTNGAHFVMHHRRWLPEGLGATP